MAHFCDGMGLRECYRLIPILETASLDDEVVATKRRIRSTLRKNVSKEGRIICDRGDSWVAIVRLPQTIENEKEAEDYFEENMRMECAPSQYDCTGQAFTNWHKVVKRNGNYWVYHSVSLDV